VIGTEHDPVVQLARAACTLELEAANLGNSPLEQESCRRRAERLRALQFEAFLDEPIPAHPLALVELAERAQARAAVVKEILTITEVTEAEICDHTDTLALARLSDALEEAKRRKDDPMRPVIGFYNGMILAAIIDTLVLLGLYGHRLALWIDAWRLQWTN
jgi:hypothetical protein